MVGRYKEIAFALKGVEWRQPGLVAVASKIAASAGEHKPISFEVPESYEPHAGDNRWKQPKVVASVVEEMLRKFDFDRDFIVSVDELHTLLVRTEPSLTKEVSQKVHDEMIAAGYDTNGDGKVSQSRAYLTLTLACDGTRPAIQHADQCSEPSVRCARLSRRQLSVAELAALWVEKGPAMAAASLAVATGDVVLSEAPSLPGASLAAAPVAAPSSADKQDLSDRLKALFSPKPTDLNA